MLLCFNISVGSFNLQNLISMKQCYYLLPIFMLLFTSVSFAQDKWTKGLITTQQEETVEGMMNAKNWRITPQKITFKATGKEGPQTYLPTEIKAFYSELTKEWYESHTVTIDQTPIKLDELKLNPESKLVEDTVFLKVLVKGEVSLFHLFDQQGKEHFFIQKDGEIKELILRKYFKKDNPKTESTFVKNYLQTSRKYRGQLAYLLSDCDKVQAAIQKADYKTKPLQKIILNYNKCKNTTPDFAYQLEKAKLSFYPLIGVGITRLRFFGELAGSSLEELTFKPAFSYRAGGGMLLTLPRTNQKWALGTELAWRSYQTTLAETHQYSLDFREIDVQAASFELSYLELSQLVRYQLPNPNWTPYIEIGVGVGLVLKHENSLTRVTTFFTTTEVETIEPLRAIRNLEQQLVLGIGGIFFKKLNASFRYEFGTGVSAIATLGSRTQTASLVLRYQF